MPDTDQLLKSICDKMNPLIENKRQIERRPASPEQATGIRYKMTVRKKRPE